MKADPIADRGWETVVCAATGPSFDEEQVETLCYARAFDLCRIIAVNDNYRRLPFADVLYACDVKWWNLHAPVVRATMGERAELWTQDAKAAETYGLRFIASKTDPGLTRDRSVIHTGGNSGYQAVNLAYLFGAKRIVLVGFDMSQSPDGKKHWFGNHPKELSQSHAYSTWIGRFDQLAVDLAQAGVTVVNASKRTALECFERAELVKAIAPVDESSILQRRSVDVSRNLQ